MLLRSSNTRSRLHMVFNAGQRAMPAPKKVAVGLRCKTLSCSSLSRSAKVLGATATAGFGTAAV